jgi:cephalosporin hydroxylase
MNQDALLSGEALKTAAREYLPGLQAAQSQNFGIFDKWFIRVMTRLAALDPGKSWEESVADEIARLPQQQGQALQWDYLRLRLFLDRWRQGRFVSYAQREKSGVHYSPKYGMEFGSDVLLTCQGAPDFLQWRGLPLMKTVFDFAIYTQLIAELRPQAVFEIGSGSGASALWLADQLALLQIPAQVHSVDLHPPATVGHPGVSFYQGDCTSPATLFNAEILSSAPHPRLVIEDAHHNVEAVLSTFHSFLKPGDYLVVEDSEIKRDDIRRFLAKHPDSYKVDTKYTDFFGRNATCALDSIFVRMA